MTHSDLLKIFGVGLALRLFWLAAFPVPYGEDGFGRIFFKDTLFLGHWLPLTQLLVYLIARLSDDIVWIRLAFAMIGSLSACGFALFLQRIASPSSAVLGGLVFSLNALYVQLTLMPYQDVVFLGLLYGSLGLLLKGRRESDFRMDSRSASILFGLSCLTRYESWFLLPLLALWKTRLEIPHRGVFGAGVRALLFFGWAPLLWLCLSQWRFGGWEGFLFQTQDGSFYAWHPHVDLVWAAGYLARMLYWVGLFGSPLVLLALPGTASAWRSGKMNGPPLRALLWLGATVMVFFLFVIGKQQDTVFRFSMIPLSITLVLSVLGLDWLRSRMAGSGNRLRVILRRPKAIAAAALVLLAVYASIPLAGLNSDPQYRDPWTIARFLEAHLGPQTSALVIADRSRELDDAAPILYQRIAAQSRLPRHRILSAGLLKEESPEALEAYLTTAKVQYLIVFRNFQPWLPADVFFADRAKQLQPVLQTPTAAVYEVGRLAGRDGGSAAPHSRRKRDAQAGA